MATSDDELLTSAMSTTEKEIFAAAFGDEVEEPTPDETEDEGDDLESDDETETPEGEEVEAKDDKDGEGEKTVETKGDEPAVKADKMPEPEGRVPPGRLREQTERTKAAEAERDTLKAEREAERKEMAELKATMNGVLAAMRQPPAQAQQTQTAQTETPPDIFEDPKGFIDNLNKGFDSKLQPVMQQLDNFRVETSMQIAHGRHGDTFAKAFDAVQKLDPRNPDDQNAVRRIYGSANPGEALVQWHKRNETLREVGDDPAKFKEGVREETRKALMQDPEFRKQLIAELRAEANTADDGRPRTEVRLPKNLSSVNGNAAARRDTVTYDDSESGIFESAWR